MAQITRRDLVVGAASRAFAQETTFSDEVKVVTLFVNVHDRSGAIATNLQKEDFLLEDTRYFSRESDVPLTIGLLIDTSRSQTGVLDRERAASNMFLDQILREGKDEAFVARFDIQVEILQNLTSSKEKLRSAFDELRIARKGSTLLYQAIRECAEREMRKQNGRKVLIVFSDGNDENSSTDITTAIEYAQSADTLVYPILFSKWPWIAYAVPTGAAYLAVVRAGARAAMQRMARETGGACFEISKEYPIARVYKIIQEQLRNHGIGFTPEPKNNGQRYRQIRLTTKQPNLIVQTRAGYYM
jgi:VWFA-related protein